MFFSLLFSDKKSFGPPLVKYTKLKRLRNSKIQHQAPEMFVWGGRGGKKSSQPTFILIFTIILIILKQSFSMETKNTILKLFYFSHPYLLSYRFTPTKILKKKISHCITSQNPFFVILHCFVAWLVFCTPLSFISEGSSFSIRYFLLYYSHYLAFTVLGEGGESLSQI